MLWTVMPLEVVLDGQDTYNPVYTEITRNNTKLIVEEMGKNSAKVIRIVSTNPCDYLDPSIQPGNIIQLQINK